MSELNKYGVDVEVWATQSSTERRRHYSRWHRRLVKSDPQRNAEFMAKRRAQQRRYMEKLKRDPSRYGDKVTSIRRYRGADIARPEFFGVTTDQWAKLTAPQKRNFLRKYVARVQEIDTQKPNGHHSETNRYGIRVDVWRALPETERRYYSAKYHKMAIKSDPVRREKYKEARRLAKRRHSQKLKGDPERMAKLREYHRDYRRRNSEQCRNLGRQYSRAYYWRNAEHIRAQTRERYDNNRIVALSRQKERRQKNKSVRAIRSSPGRIISLIEQAISRSLPNHLREELIARMRLAILDGKLSIKDIAREARSFLTAYNREFDTFKTLSLDAPVRGHDRGTYMDLLEDKVDQ